MKFGIGLSLQRSRTLYGPEIIIGGDMSSAVGKTIDKGAVTGGKYEYSGAAVNNALFSAAYPFVTGERYTVTYTVDSVTGSNYRMVLGGGNGISRNTAGTFTETIVCGALPYWIFSGGSTGVTQITVDNVSVRRLY